MACPKVSICIPAYRQAAFFQRALESVMRQKFQDYEIIVSDDTPDDSVMIIAQAFAFGPRLKYFKNECRLGAPGNWNKAISLASGEYIKVLHHDDWFYDADSLGNFVKLLDENRCADFAFGASWNYAGDNTLVNRHFPGKAEVHLVVENPKALLRGNIIGSPSATIYRRNSDIQFDPKLKWLVDIDFYIRVLKRNKAVVFSDSANVCIGLEAGRVTEQCQANPQVEVWEAMYVYSKYKSKLSDFLRELDYFYFFFMKWDAAQLSGVSGLCKAQGFPLTAKMALFRVELDRSALFRKISCLKTALVNRLKRITVSK